MFSRVFFSFFLFFFFCCCCCFVSKSIGLPLEGYTEIYFSNPSFLSLNSEYDIHMHKNELKYL